MLLVFYFHLASKWLNLLILDPQRESQAMTSLMRGVFLLVVLYGFRPASAEMVTLNFSGTASTYTGSTVDVQGQLTYDSSLPLSSGRADFAGSGLSYSLNLTMGSTTVKTGSIATPNNYFFVQSGGSGGTDFEIHAQVPYFFEGPNSLFPEYNQIGLILNAKTPIFSTTNLPTSFPTNLTQYSQALAFFADARTGNSYAGTIKSLSTVPEPSGMALTLLGILGGSTFLALKGRAERGDKREKGI
jgi:hypothetical protein